MNRSQKKEKLKHKREVQKLKRKYIKKSPFAIAILCNECKYRNNCKFKNGFFDIDYCSNGVIDLDIIREYIKRGKIK